MTTDIGRGCGKELVTRVRVLISGFPAIYCDGRRSEIASRSWPGATKYQQIIGDDPQADPALHPALPTVPAPAQSMTALERADPPFTSRAPAEGRTGQPGALLVRLAWQHDVPDPTVLRRTFIGARGEPPIGDGQVRRVTEQRDVPIQCGRPEGAVRLAALTDLVVGDELRLGLLDLHEPSELGGTRQLALADNLRMRLEQTHHLAGVVRLAPEHAGARLRQDAAHQLDRRGQRGGGVPLSRSGDCGVGVAQHRARDPHEALVEDLHLRLAPLADRRAHAAPGRATALGDLKHPAGDTARALSDPLPDPLQRAREDPDPVRQERGVGGVVHGGFHDGRVEAQPPASDEAAGTPQGHQPGQHVLEHGLVQQVGQPDQRFGVRDPLAIDPAEGAMDQAPPHLTLALIEAPVVEVLEDEHPQDHGGRCSPSAPAPTLRMTLRQGLCHAIDEHVIIEHSVDLPEGGIPELVGVRQEHFYEAALLIRSPHHGASGEAREPQSLHRVSRIAARVVRVRRSLTIAHPRRSRQANWSIWTSADTLTPHKHWITPVCFAPGSSYTENPLETQTPPATMPAGT